MVAAARKPARAKGRRVPGGFGCAETDFQSGDAGPGPLRVPALRVSIPPASSGTPAPGTGGGSGKAHPWPVLRGESIKAREILRSHLIDYPIRRKKTFAKSQPASEMKSHSSRLALSQLTNQPLGGPLETAPGKDARPAGLSLDCSLRSWAAQEPPNP